MTVSGRWRRALVMGVLAALATAAVAGAASPGDAAVTTQHRQVRWTGGPLTGPAADPSQCTPLSCDEFTVTVGVPAAAWRDRPGGVVVRTEWSDPDAELDLYAFDAAGTQIAVSQIGGRTFQQIYLSAPAPGPYRIRVVAFAAVEVSYGGTAELTSVEAPQAELRRSRMHFAHTTVDPQILASEPRVWVGDDGAVFAAAPWGATTLTSLVWRSLDSARTFQLLDDRPVGGVSDPRHRPCTVSGGGGDVDVITDRTGRVYFADLEVAEITVGWSTDGGDTWTCNARSASSPEDDRPWLAPAPSADGSGPSVDAYLSYVDLVSGQLPGGSRTKPQQVHVDVTRDGGRTWTKSATVGAGLVPSPGPLFAAQDGTVYQVFGAGTTVWLARSDDGGRSFTTHAVSKRPGDPDNAFVAGAVDAAGDVAVAWVDAGSFAVLLSRSLDRGASWSPPVQVSPRGQVAVLPWVAAGSAGDVAVSWYGATSGGALPDAVAPRTPWHAWVARSVRPESTPRSFELAQMSETPTHLGAVCTSCGGYSGLGDFFTIGIDRHGALVAAYDDAVRTETAAPYDQSGGPRPFVVVARQIADSPRAAALDSREPAGDARFPTHAADGRNVEQLDLVTPPAAELTGARMRLTFSLGSAKDLARALSAHGSGAATEAYWVTTWKAGGRVEYAGMHTDAIGRPSFFGGLEPLGVVHPATLDQRYASYPPALALSGRADPRTGRVTIDVPLATFGLSAGTTLHGLQSFSMTGLLAERTASGPLEVVDSTSGSTQVLR